MLNRNIILEGQIKSWLGRVNTEDMNLYEKGLLLNAVKRLYQATDDEDYRTFVMNVLDASVSEDGIVAGTEDSEDVDDLYFGNQIFFAVDEVTAVKAAKLLDKENVDQEEKMIAKYKNAILNIEKEIEGLDGTMSLEDTYKCQPFYMNYETVYGGKERYNAIIANYNRAVKEPVDISVLVKFVCGLVDTMEVMAQPLYEIYDKMRSYYKGASKAVMANAADLKKRPADPTNPLDPAYGAVLNSDELLFVYAVLKGCRMKAIQTEKYEHAQLDILNAAEDAVCAGKVSLDADSVDSAALVLAYAESLRNREYQDYGRNKGGALWS